jgi:hypothetical protein
MSAGRRTVQVRRPGALDPCHLRCRKLAATALALSVLAFAAPRTARADQVNRAGSWTPPPAPQDEDELDIIGSVRAGLGYSELLSSRILSLSFEDQFRVHRFSDDLGFTVVFGMDGQRPLDEHPAQRGFLAMTLGPGLLLRPEDGPAFTLAGTVGPLWQTRDDNTKLAGFGIGLRVEVYPFYQSLLEVVKCDRGTFSTYVLSGLHGWAQTRRDWLGSSGESYAVGFGFDLGRNVLLPILGATLHASCAVR